MRINEKLVINFEVNDKIKKNINILEKIYQKFNSFSDEKKKGDIGDLYERVFFNKIGRMEVFSLAAKRKGQINDKEFLILTNRYEEY